MSVVDQKIPLMSGFDMGGSTSGCANANKNSFNDVPSPGHGHGQFVQDQYGGPMSQSYSIVGSSLGQHGAKPVLPPLYTAIHNPYASLPMMGAPHQARSSSSLSISSTATGSSSLLPIVHPLPIVSVEQQAKRTLDRFLFTGPGPSHTQPRFINQNHYVMGSDLALPSLQQQKPSFSSPTASLPSFEEQKLEAPNRGLASDNAAPHLNIAGSMNSPTNSSPNSSSKSTPVAPKSKRASRQGRKAKADHQHDIQGIPKKSTNKDLPLAERRKYICKICSRGFTTSGHLARHNRIHTGEKRHKCQFPSCHQRFSRHDNCIQHYRTHFKNNSSPDEPSTNA
ncbi:unnamed protein product [Kluyveromyces dobzhanskii CBS 2104]|uniref:WGS project CCBQ000000000 data, contig 00058 n=1 Tax=Kluyveromyces dobzhanskii CBS 2104 TaxID=1427455 RepID=A0A0A8LDC7_9SACH|nr:unnamed protein product [Kluyveromyces dobzhanskii CBS 2104]